MEILPIRLTISKGVMIQNKVRDKLNQSQHLMGHLLIYYLMTNYQMIMMMVELMTGIGDIFLRY